MWQNPTILECTLRDGSYTINFQFSARDTEMIAGALDGAGFPLIEVGHGVGLGASEARMGVALESDLGYMQAAARGVRKGRWGMFCIPGIANLDHLATAIDQGMGFIRIGTEVADVANSQPFIEKAKASGLLVFANFMKSYVSSPEEFAERALESEGYGTDCVYLVDSAGGMFPDDIRRYVEAVRKRTTVRLGFHGHNNLGMGVANALAAIDAGIEVIDSSLQGFGRSAGNTPTEQLLCALAKRDHALGFDVVGVMDIGERYILPLITARGLSSVDMVSGLAQFHSSYMGVIREMADKFAVDPRHLIIAVCAKDKMSAPRALVEAEARKLADKYGTVDSITSRFMLNHYFGSEQK